VLLVAAALAFAVVLTFAGVLRKVFLAGCSQHTSERQGTGGRFGVSGNRLGVETSGGAAEKAGEGRGQDEVVNTVSLHEEFLSSGWHEIYAAESGYYPLQTARKSMSES
jgi:hypothetical protein